MWVVILGSHLPYHQSACWAFTSQGPDDDVEARARAFAEFVTREIDPAQVLQTNDPVDELLRWRTMIADVEAYLPTAAPQATPPGGPAAGKQS
jgi:hypothetical protein